MPVNQPNLDVKLAAIQAKDVVAIAAAHVNIPQLGTNYTAAALQTWLNTCSAALNSAKTMSDAQVSTAITSLYNLLTAGGKAIADKILANQPYTLIVVSALEYDRLRQIILYHFVSQ